MLEKNLDFSCLKDYGDYIKVLRNKQNCSVFGMGQSEKILSALNVTGKIFYVAADMVTAKKVYEELKQLTGNEASYFPAGADVSLYRNAQSNENNIERIKTIYGLVTGTSRAVVTSIDAVFSLLPKIQDFKNNIVTLKVNQTIEISALQSQFVKMGYVSSPLVGESGQFSVRGDIVDIFPVNGEYPFRIEFFDNLIESIKVFDPETQRSSENKREIKMCPYTNLLLDNKQLQETITKLETLKKSKLTSRDAEVHLGTIIDEVLARISNKDMGFALDFLFPILSDNLGSIFEYLSDDFVVVFDECKRVYDALNQTEEDIKERKKTLKNSGDTLPVSQTGYLSKQEVVGFFERYSKVAHQKITNANNLFKPDAVFNFRFAPLVKYSSNFSEFVSDVCLWIMDGYKVLICAGNEKRAKELSAKLENNDVYIGIDPRASFESRASAIIPKFLSTGFVLPTEKIVVVGTYDIFPKPAKQTSFLKKKTVFSVPEIGSFVVHRVHGIGRCDGVTKLTGSFGTKDFIVVSYHGGDKLYVPIDQMDQLDKYTAPNEPKKLSKIGGTEFAQVKERVKKQIKEMAFSLLKLYAERETKKGYIYNKDDELQQEFENKFPYTETEDQLSAIADVKQDMENGKVMDRLICGDVGFGKTEVALRSAFKAIVNGKQVAFIAPTTILARQHYNTCVARMAEFGIRVEVLDRFVPAKKVKEVLLAVKQHKVDLLCGTHRVLGKDVAFEDLGLVILDEEQKFGVEHKEKIKLDQKDIDVLTLSATPIPRTLHMSLTGIRDISVIATPPTTRTPTQTYVTEYSDSLLKTVVNRELNRNGQVFIVYNRVETIYAFKEHVQAIVPNAKIIVGHGQLSGAELEDVIYKFYSGEADVLICTTIIENGIDLPNANSLIVMDSDRLGLSQLYQIRGRVGRGSRGGFAYFTYKREKALSEESYKRLEAIAEFTEFGSGFKVAMRDLEIRGSGNVFGAEQHGHIEKVGYELYSKMLHNALLELKGKPVEEDVDVQVKVNMDAYIPEHFVQTSDDRMTLYKNISLISSREEKETLRQEIIDRFGKLPEALENLIQIAYIKSLCKKIKVTEIFMNDTTMRLTFVNADDILKQEAINSTVTKYSRNVVLNFGSVATISFKGLGYNAQANFKLLTEFVETVINNKLEKKN